MSDEDVAKFAVRRFEFPGLDIRTRQTRSYPNGDLAVHAIGYVGAISEADLGRIDRAAYSGTSLIGKLGIESAYEARLHGTNGLREVLVNASGRSVDKQGAFVPILRTQSPMAGEDIILAMDLKAQRAAEDALAGRRGAIVAIDPNNGDVIAMTSRPGFDPNLFGRGITRAEYQALSENIDKPLLDRAMRGVYPPGSTVKPVIALAGLVYHLVDPDQPRFCTGQFHLPGSSHLYREGKDGHHGWMNLEDAIAHSCFPLRIPFFDLTFGKVQTDPICPQNNSRTESRLYGNVENFYTLKHGEVELTRARDQCQKARGRSAQTVSGR